MLVVRDTSAKILDNMNLAQAAGFEEASAASVRRSVSSQR